MNIWANGTGWAVCPVLGLVNLRLVEPKEIPDEMALDPSK